VLFSYIFIVYSAISLCRLAILLGISLGVIRALSETRGASLEYEEAINELASMQDTFLQVVQMRSSSTSSRATVNAVSHIVLLSVNLIAEFLEKTKKYRERFFGSGSGNTVSDG
jgi:hypothetical protein